jgi:two-component system phosphate regulon response regulator PhoB
LADDNADLLAILSARFRAFGFLVVEAGDGGRALELIRSERPAAAVLDVMMPELNGFQVCRRVKQDPDLSAVKVVLLTAKDTEADRFWGGEVGADLYLAKPMEPAQVVEQVKALLG